MFKINIKRNSNTFKVNKTEKKILVNREIRKIDINPVGRRGPQGADGEDGNTGASGPIGSTGVQGATGNQGATGPSGNTGVQGIKGDTGSQGFTGPVGIQGTTGPTGPQGPVGSQGATGSLGNTGAQGNTGSTGPQGIQGDPGTQGATGILGSTGATGVVGNTGSAGVQGATGNTGSQGSQGLQGNTGNTGTQGSTGASGVSFIWQGAWDDVTSYVINEIVEHDGSSWIAIADNINSEPSDISTVWQLIAQMGATGPQGSTGNTGAQGATGVSGTQGSTGATGVQGIQGTQGGLGNTGNTGAQGVHGNTGNTGVIGATGNTGNTGVSFIWEGLWLAATSYQVNDVVENNGSSYICILAHTSGTDADEPGVGLNSDTYWELMAEKGVTGATGIQGATGTTGSAGAQGATGNTGTAGGLGNTGNTGVQGIQGVMGATGPQGIAGSDGGQGATGNTGTAGALGNTGNTGSAGALGNTGNTGVQGATGITGPVGGPISIPYVFSTTTTDSDPGAGILRLNQATQNTATVIRADLLSSDTSDWSAVLATLADSTNAVKGHIRLFKTLDPTKWLVFTVSAVASPAGYKNITVANVSSSSASPFIDTDPITLTFSRSGDMGNTGTAGAAGATGNTGVQGATGTAGSAGSQGATGATGPSALTTKGDILVYTTVTTRKAVGSDGQVIVADSNQTDGLAWADGLSDVMSRQALINGNLNIWQRATTKTFSADSSGLEYSLIDHYWTYLAKNGGTLPATIVVSRQALTPGDIANAFYFLRINPSGAGSSFGSGAAMITGQRIEHGVRFLCGLNKKVTVSFWAKSSIASKKIGIYLNQVYGTGGSPSATDGLTGQVWTLTSSWVKYTLTLTTATLVGKTFGTNNDDYLEFNLHYMWGSAYNSLLGTGSAEGFVGSGNIDIAQIQICVGDQALPFTPKIFSVDLADCQRYYFKTFPYATAPAQNAGVGGSLAVVSTAVTNFGRTFEFPVKMRATPTITTYNPSATNANWRDITNVADKTATVTVDGDDAVLIVGATGGVGATNRIHIAAEAEL